MKLFVDMDGVLADFDSHHEAVFGIRSGVLIDNVDWEAVREQRGFYADIPPMPDMRELWGYIERFNPTVLTGVPEVVEEAAKNKRVWVRRHLGEHVPVICCRSSDKCMHAEPGDVLIDDWDKYRNLWEARGGRWVTHISAASTIAALRAMGV